MSDEKKHAASALQQAMYEDLESQEELTAKQMAHEVGGTGTTAPNYFQQGGPFTTAQKASVYYSHTEMTNAASMASSEFSGTYGNTTGGDTEEGAYTSEALNPSSEPFANVSGNIDFAHGVVSALENMNSKSESEYATMQGQTPTQAETAAFTSKEALQAEIATAGATALQEVTAPMVANEIQGQQDGAYTYEGQTILHQVRSEAKTYQQSVVNDTTQLLQKDGLSQAQITKALNELDEGPSALAADQLPPSAPDGLPPSGPGALPPLR